MVIDDIRDWFAGGSDFDQGIALLRLVNRNVYFVKNIERSRRQSTLVYELGKSLRRAGGEVPGSEFKVPGSEFKVPGSEFKVQSLKRAESREQVASSQKPEARSQKQVARSQRQVASSKEQGAVVLREQFPFLGEADCPDELKILVADMITAHTNYMQGHSQLFAVAHKGEDACFTAAKLTVENYLENRRIWKELEHYAKTKTLLREHPIFDRRKKTDALHTLPLAELKRREKNLKRQLTYRNSMDENTGDVYLRETEIADIKKELAIVHTLIEKRGKNGK